jgi:hypothetical protein
MSGEGRGKLERVELRMWGVSISLAMKTGEKYVFCQHIRQRSVDAIMLMTCLNYTLNTLMM